MNIIEWFQLLTVYLSTIIVFFVMLFFTLKKYYWKGIEEYKKLLEKSEFLFESLKVLDKENDRLNNKIDELQDLNNALRCIQFPDTI